MKTAYERSRDAKAAMLALGWTVSKEEVRNPGYKRTDCCGRTSYKPTRMRWVARKGEGGGVIADSLSDLARRVRSVDQYYRLREVTGLSR
jgi:hypothetical protein